MTSRADIEIRGRLFRRADVGSQAVDGEPWPRNVLCCFASPNDKERIARISEILKKAASDIERLTQDDAATSKGTGPEPG